jgi:hypothetical protein
MNGLTELLARAKGDPDILGVFGSVCRGEKTKTSDVDVCLILSPHFLNTGHLAFSRKKLEYLNDFSLDVQVFQALPLYIRKRVLGEGRLLFVRDEDQLYDLAIRTAKEYEDFKHIYHDYLREVEIGRS